LSYRRKIIFPIARQNIGRPATDCGGSYGRKNDYYLTTSKR